MKYTTNLNLKKPDYTDPVDIQDINSNMDTIDSAIQSKANSSQVLTNVPANAKFTDTTYTEITTAEIDTGTSSTLRTITARRLKYLLDKIVALFPTKTSELTNDSGFLTSVTKSDVGLSNVDNTSDLNKPISTVTQTALDTKVDNSRVLTDVPLNAKFTDTNTTYSEISTAEIDAGTSSTLRTITGRRIKYVLDKVQGWINALTKSDVGLSNVDNVKQASKTEFDSHDTNTTIHITSAERTNWNAKETTTGSKAKADAAESNAKDYADTELAKKVDKVTGKVLSTNDYTTAEKNKLSGIATGAQVNTVTSVAGKTGAVTVTKSDVSLGSVLNYDLSTQSEAETGVSNAKYMTPLRTKQAIDKQVADKNYVTQSELGNAGFGDMVKAVYDTNNNGIVDNAEKVNGFTVGVSVPSNAKFTDTVYTHPTTHPYSMITGTPTSLPASGGHALSATHLLGDDTRSVNSAPSVYMNGGARYAGRAGWQTEFKDRTAINSPPLSGTYVYLQTHTPWSDPSGGYPIQVAYGNGTPCWRVGVSTSAWSAWQSVNDNGNASTVNGFTVGINVPANAKFTDTVYTHPGSGTNPHGTTKDNVGLGSVLNYGISTQAEAQAGTSNAKYMTPLGTKQAIDNTNTIHVGSSAPSSTNIGWIDTSL